MFEKIAALDLILTLTALALGLVLTGLAVWLERKPRVRLMPSLIPPHMILGLGFMTCFLSIVHLLNLVGVHTGR